MALLETLIIGIGAAVAKGVLKMWLKDDSIILASATTTADILRNKIGDLLASNKAKRDFERIQERSAKSFMQMIEKERPPLEEDEIKFVANAAAEVLTNSLLTTELLAEQNLDPGKLADFYLMRTGAEGGNPGLANDSDPAKKELYARLLHYASQQIIDVSSQFPQFDERMFGELLQGQDELFLLCARVLDGMDRLLAAQSGVDPEAERFETDYRLACIRRLDQLQLFGVDLHESNKRYRLSVAYVTLQFDQNAAIETDNNSESHSKVETLGDGLRPVDRVLGFNKRLLVRGQAGSGKTTLLQWMAVFCARKEHKDKLVDFNRLVPFFIRLRDFDNEDLPSAGKFASLISSALGGEPPNWAHKLLQDGRGIVLIDGLDEAPEERREAVRDWLRDLVMQYPEARYIVTTRPYAIEEGWLDVDAFEDTTLQEMSREDVTKFVTHWHDAVASGLQDTDEKTRIPKLAEALSLKFRQSSNLAKLATSPLLCAMICALHRDRQEHLPDDRIELYKACIEMFFRRDEERKISMGDYLTLTDPQRLLLLQTFAWWLIRNGKSSASSSEAVDRFTATLEQLKNAPRNATGKEVLRSSVERVAILREFTAEKIDFPHRTFQEYLAAIEAVADDDYQLLIENAEKEQWREVAIMTAGLISNTTKAESYLVGLLTRGDNDHEIHQTLYLIAAAAFESLARLPENSTIQTEISNRLRTVIPPKSIKSGIELAKAGNLVVPLLRYNSKALADDLAASIRTLALVDTEESIAALKDYMVERRTTVTRQIKTSLQFMSEDTRDAVIKHWLEVGHKVDLSGLHVADLDAIVPNSTLRELILEGCVCLANINGIGRCTSLLRLNVSKCSSLADIGPIQFCRNLKVLNLIDCQLVTSIGAIESLHNLEEIHLDYCSSIVDLQVLGQLPKLQTLSLCSCLQITALDFLKNMQSLNTLYLMGVTRLLNIEDIGACPSLRILYLSNSVKIAHLKGIEACSKLWCLYIRELGNLRDLKALVTCPSLRELRIENCPRLVDLSGLSGCKTITMVSLDSCSGIADVNSLAECNSLTDLRIRYCVHLVDISILKDMKNLYSLDLSGCKQLRDIIGLGEIESLAHLNLSGCSSITDESVQLLKSKKPNLSITGRWKAAHISGA